MKCSLLGVLLALCLPVAGQTSVSSTEPKSLPDSASTSKLNADKSGEPEFIIQPVHFAPPALTLESGPPRERRRVVDRSFWLTALFQIGATIGDIESTQYGLGHGAREINPLYGSHPSRAKQYGITMPITAAVLGLSYHLKRSAPHSRYWLIPPLAVGSMHAVAACRNMAIIQANNHGR